MDSVNKDSLQQSILQAVDTIVSRRVKDAAYDKTITGTINSLVGIKNKKSIYKINYGNGFFNATVLNDEETYIKNTPVYIFIPQGDFSKEKIILGRASNINTDLNLNITNAVLNNFSIVGKNNLTKTKNIGLRSYHDINEEKIDPTTFSHRIQILYNEEDPDLEEQINIESLSNLKRYLSEGSAIMLKADFRTDLSLEQKRQATGRYGLIFELLFDNEKSNWGSTQEEILKNVCEKKEIKANTEFGEKSFLDYVFNKDNNISIQNAESAQNINTIQDIINNLKDDDDDNFKNYISGEDSQLKRIISELTALYTTYVKNSPEKNQEIVQETITSFLKMLQGLVKIDTATKVINEYNNWLKTEPNLEKEKKVYLQLDSNSMVGAPLYFKNWTSQHEIFKIDNLDSFKKINKILFFKTGFIQNETYDKQKTEDIFVKDIGFYVLKPLDSISGDYSLKIEAEETGAVVSKKGDKITFKGSFYRKLNDLSQNLKLTYYWFKENPSVVVGGEKFNRYGGVGWELVSDKNENSRYFETEFNENPAAKNSYKCVAVFSENSETEIVIIAPFIVYNSTNGHIIELTSDQGTVFQFNSGTPIITCLIDGEEKNLIEDGNILKFYWSIVLENEEEIPFYSQIDLKNLSIDNIENYQFQDQYFNNVKFYKLEEDKPIEIEKDKETGYIDTTIATRLMYPMINLKSDEKIKVKCVVIKNDSVTLGNAELEFENRGGALVDGYHIEFENDNQIFQYDEYGNSPKLNKLDPLEVLPIKAKLISPSGSEFSGSNVQVDWIFNLENSMIIPLGDLTLNSATGNTDTVRNETLCYFDIKSIYDPNAINNQIMCHINFNDQDYYKETNLFFTKIGENGTNGTDIAVRITPVSDNSILDVQALTLYTFTDDEDKDEEGKAKIKGFLNEKYKKEKDDQLSISIQLTKAEESGFQVNVYQKGKLLPSDKYQSYWNLAGNPSEIMISKGKNFDLRKESETNTYHLSWDSTKNNPYQLQIIKSHIKFSDKIITKDDDGNEIETETNKKEFYGYYPLPIIYFKDKKDIATYANNRLAIDKNSYLKEVTYNADGRNPIYNHNQGLKIINLPDWCNELNTKIIAKGGWSEEENQPDFTILEQETIFDKENHSIMIYILPNDACSGSKTNNRIEVKIYKEENTNGKDPDIIISAPIIFTLNTFGLASLNAWDGNSVTIDEEGGYIMAPQIGAGEKDNNNRFTGIVMGKTETYTGSSEKEKQIGLFGYKDGLQSIFLDAETGDAIFGLPDVEERKDEEGNLKKFYKKSNREAEDNYQEGRIELRPGGTSIIGGWKIGRKSLYYTGTGTLGEKNGEDPHDYVPDIKTGVIKEDSNNLYGGHHDKDIKHNDSGILLSGGKNPYVSIKSEPFVKDNVSSDSDSLLAEGDSLELQLDPNTPTLFTIFRHNGKDRYRDDWKEEENLVYRKNSRTFLAGINSRGEFVANSIGNKNITYNSTDDLIGENIASKFYFNSLNAFNDREKYPTHIGFQMTATNKILGRLFMSLSDLNKTIASNDFPILHISGGNEFFSGENRLSWWGEYLKGLSLHGRAINLYVPDENVSSTSALRSKRETNSNILINQDFGQIQIFEKDRFLLSRKEDSKLETTQNFNLFIGENQDQNYDQPNYYIKDNGNEISVSLNPYNKAYKINSNDEEFYVLYSQINESQLNSTYYIKSNDGFKQIDKISYKYNDIYIPLINYNTNYYKYKKDEENYDYILENKFLQSLYEYNESTESYHPVQSEEDITILNNGYFIVEKQGASNFNTVVEQNNWFVHKKYIDVKNIYNDYTRKNNEEYIKYKENEDEHFLPSSSLARYKKVKEKKIYFPENASAYYKHKDEEQYILINNFNITFSLEEITIITDYSLLEGYYFSEEDDLHPKSGIYDSNREPVEPVEPVVELDSKEDLEKWDTTNNEPLYATCMQSFTTKIQPVYISDNNGDYVLVNNDQYINKSSFNNEIKYYKYNENECYSKEENVKEYYSENEFEENNYFYLFNEEFYNLNYIEKNSNNNENILYVKIGDNEEYISLLSYNNGRYYQTKEGLEVFLPKIYLNTINIEQKYKYSNINNQFLEIENFTEEISDYYYQTTLSSANFLFDFYNIDTIEKEKDSNLRQKYIFINNEYILKTEIETEKEFFEGQELNKDTKYMYLKDVDEQERHFSISEWENKTDAYFSDSGTFFDLFFRNKNTSTKTLNKNFNMKAKQANFEIGSIIGNTLYSLKTSIFDTSQAGNVPMISIKNYNLPISIKTFSQIFDLSLCQNESNEKNPYGQIAFNINRKDKTKNNETILGAFLATTVANSADLLNNGLIITSRNGYLEHSNQLKLIAHKIGSEQEYSEINPQIFLQAGETTNDSKSFSTKLILNSSDTGWRADDTNIDIGWKDKKRRPWSSYPLFKVQGKTAFLGLFVQNSLITTEVFYVSPPTIINNTLEIPEAARLTFSEKNYENSKTSSSTLAAALDALWARINSLQEQLTTLANNASSYATKSDLGNYYTKRETERDFAPKNHTHNYASATHTHPINYYLGSSPNKYVTSVGQGRFNTTGQTGAPNGKSSGYNK